MTCVAERKPNDHHQTGSNSYSFQQIKFPPSSTHEPIWMLIDVLLFQSKMKHNVSFQPHACHDWVPHSQVIEYRMDNTHNLAKSVGSNRGTCINTPNSSAQLTETRAWTFPCRLKKVRRSPCCGCVYTALCQTPGWIYSFACNIVRHCLIVAISKHRWHSTFALTKHITLGSVGVHSQNFDLKNCAAHSDGWWNLLGRRTLWNALGECHLHAQQQPDWL